MDLFMDLAALLAENYPFGDIILGWLNIIDVLALRVTCKRVRSTIRFSAVKTRLDARLRHAVGLPAIELFSLGCAVTGSFLLGELYGKNYHSKVDLMQISERRDNTRNLLPEPFDMLYTRMYSIRVFVPGEVYCTVISSDNDIGVTICRYKNAPINSIAITPGTITFKQFVEYGILAFCRNYYDGTRLYIGDLDAVLRKECRVDCVTETQRTLYGEKLKPDKDPYQYVREHILRYEMRGFMIERDDTLGL